MRRATGVAIAAVVLATGARPPAAAADVTGSNLLLYQIGNLPYVDPANRTSLYDQANVLASVPGGRIGLRFETQRTSTGDPPAYARITQRYLDWSGTDHLRVRVGTFTSLLGRGLVQRAFEVPGVVLEDPGVRTQHALSRDVDGVLVAVDAGPVSFTGLSGSPTDASAPRDLSADQGTVSGGQIALRPLDGLGVGSAYARIPGAGEQVEVTSAFVDVDPLRLARGPAGRWTVYAEYAGRNLPFDEWRTFSTSRAVPHALYAATVVDVGPLGVSLEAKSYRGFRLGVNDPPSLVRQQTAVLLNRATHVLDADDEVGHQAEATWTAPRWGAVTVNWSRGDGHVSAGGGEERLIRFDERYGEIALRPVRVPAVNATVFYDEHREDLLSERRSTGGGFVTLERGILSATVTAETSRGRRSFLAAPFRDTYGSLAVGRAGWGSVALVMERSDDPDFTDHADTPGVETAARAAVSGVLSASFAPGQELRLFAGERRGGLACTAGTCYLVPAFRGVEVTLLTRL